MPDQSNAEEQTLTLLPLAGIKRDGTLLDGQSCSDGKWVRFQRGKAKKMGGFRRITDQLSGPVRKVIVWSRKQLNACICFHTGGIETLLVDSNLVGNDVNDRTPSGFVSREENVWTADTQYDDAVGSQGTIVVAHCNQSGLEIDDDTASKPYWAMANSSNSQFQEIADAPAVSGGVLCVAPYTILFGSDGLVAWSDANQPQVWSTSTNPGDAGADRVTGAKIVAGLPLRAGQLAALLWSLDSVIRMDWIGGTAIWRFSTVSTQSSILAQNSVIEYDGIYFWIGIDRFMHFDSSAKELPNDMNQNWFFDNLNYKYRQKIWVTKITRFGEIVWHYPRGDSVECNATIIYNVRLKTWYDTSISRSAGFYSQIFRYPVWAGSEVEPSGKYGLYQHEFGKNAIIGDVEEAIESYYVTQNFGLSTGGVGDSIQGSNRWTRLARVEPDFVQSENMTISVIGYEFAQSAPTISEEKEFSPSTGKIDLREQKRHIALKFKSNTLNGSFEAGRIIIHTEPGDNRS